MPKLSSIGLSDTGLKRKNNEDALWVRADLGLCALADGVGGAADGELASEIFIRNTMDIFNNGGVHTERQTIELMSKVFVQTNEAILDLANDHSEREGMGCTGEIVVFYGDKFVIGHVGDSRVYLFRKGRLRQLTKDHSLVQQQLDDGLITQADARKHPLRHVILRAVGADDRLVVDIIKGKVAAGDLFLVCSDGLTDMIDNAMVGGILALDVPIDEKAGKLVSAANSAGGSDNITVILNAIETQGPSDS
ncbi:MAG: protein phosphatase 2C domain-containing protein [Syntrophobacteraceae bacterium]|nr:protein phosphatase 2C domain-containing protein [Syntrophobacteraceae bacterium]